VKGIVDAKSELFKVLQNCEPPIKQKEWEATLRESAVAVF
jgi:hypothetical protein